MEEWREVLDGWYAVSDRGRVKRLRPDRFGRGGEALIQPTIAGKGYLSFMPSINGKQRRMYVHTLVAAAFIGPRPRGRTIDHVDTCKTNNRSSNLEYVTHPINCRRARDLGIKVGCTKLTPTDVRAIRALRVAGWAARHLATKYKVVPSTIHRIIRGNTWQ